ncbi:MAG TPA: ATP-binding protein [Terriglobales bacterium]|nr:ATP-binding protein [Terriglobales bacterium]
MSSPGLLHCDFDSDRTRLRASLSFPADAGGLNKVVDAVMKVVAAVNCACGQEQDVELALREALANAVVHGARGDASKQVQCCVACDDEHGLLVIVRDPGEGFDPARLPSPLYGRQLYERNGRGVFLINQLMDHVEYRNGGTEIRMRKFTQPKNCGLGG